MPRPAKGGLDLKHAHITISIMSKDKHQQLLKQRAKHQDQVINETVKGRFHVIERMLPSTAEVNTDQCSGTSQPSSSLVSDSEASNKSSRTSAFVHDEIHEPEILPGRISKQRSAD